MHNMHFVFFVYSLRMRKDLRDIFDQIRVTGSNMVYNRMFNDKPALNNNSNLYLPSTSSEQPQSKLKSVINFLK